MVVDVEAPTYVIGDVHGNYRDVCYFGSKFWGVGLPVLLVVLVFLVVVGTALLFVLLVLICLPRISFAFLESHLPSSSLICLPRISLVNLQLGVELTPGSIVFLGDYVDRGAHSIETGMLQRVSHKGLL